MIIGIVIFILLVISLSVVSIVREWDAVIQAFSVVISICVVIFGCAFIFCWKASEVKAEVINAEYGTNYTVEQVFYASDAVEVIQKIKRQRIEVNGDIFKQK